MLGEDAPEVVSEMEEIADWQKRASLDIGMEEEEGEANSLKEWQEMSSGLCELVVLTVEDVLKMELNSPKEATLFYHQYNGGKGFTI
ncbi:hypothetical protein AHAS_Ahas13G0256800 [Arachis hypogaea]